MKKMRHKVRKLLKGFTLIELLIVLAIITILSNIAFSTYVNAKDNAHDSTVKLVLSSLRSSALDEAFNYNPYSFASICQSTPVDLALTNLRSTTGVTNSNYSCTATTNEWAIVFPLRKDSAYWCADATGFSNFVTGFLSSNLPGTLNCSNANYIPQVPSPTPPPPVVVPPPTPPTPNNPPTISLIGAYNPFKFWSPSANPFSGNGVGANKYNEPGYIATDPEDGNISASVFITGPILVSQSGPNSCRNYNYKITYGVVDSGGLASPYVVRDIIHHKCNTNHSNSGYTYGADDNDISDGI